MMTMDLYDNESWLASFITFHPGSLCKVPLDTIILQTDGGCYMHVSVVLECDEFSVWGMFRVAQGIYLGSTTLVSIGVDVRAKILLTGQAIDDEGNFDC